jgi:hypothetical protein
MYFPDRANRLTLPILVLVAVVDHSPPRLPYTGVGGEEDRTTIRVHILPPGDDLTYDDIRLGGARGGEQRETAKTDARTARHTRDQGRVRPVRY